MLQYAEEVLYAFELAEGYARDSQNVEVGLSHLVAGVLWTGNTVGATALFNSGVTHDLLKHERPNPDSRPDIGGRLPLTWEAKDAIEWARILAEREGAEEVNTRHLVLGIWHRHESFLGIKLERVKENMERITDVEFEQVEEIERKTTEHWKLGNVMLSHSDGRYIVSDSWGGQAILDSEDMDDLCRLMGQVMLESVREES